MFHDTNVAHLFLDLLSCLDNVIPYQQLYAVCHEIE
jgi:hypothetical protein